MSATETLEIVKLSRHTKPLTEKEATRIVDYVEQQKGEAATKQTVTVLCWAVGLLTVVMIGGFSWLRSDIQDLRVGQQNINAKLDQILVQQKR